MQLIPDWMPNVHPLIVHFPIALLIIAVTADLAGLLFRRYRWLRPAALWLYVFGAVGTIGAYLSGKQAADIVNFTPASYPVVSSHADLALYTMLFFSIYALARLLIVWKKWEQKTAVSVTLLLIAIGGLWLVQQTAERGGELVFRYGVGTNTQTKIEQNNAGNGTPAATINPGKNGSWHWQAGKDAALSLRRNFQLLQGDWQDLVLQVVKSEDGALAVSIQTSRKVPFLLAFGPDLKNVQLSARVNPVNFKGRFFLTHHISGPATYDFLAVENDEARLGRMKNGATEIFDSGKISSSSWLTIKAVSSSGHYRGYVNGALIAHGHGSDLKAGRAGFALLGTGSVQLTNIEALSLDKDAPMMDMEGMINKDGQRMPHGTEENGHQH